MTWAELIAVGGFGIGTLTLLWKISTNGQSEKKRIYERIDEEREKADIRYVHKDVCSIAMREISDHVKEIKADVKELLKRGGE